MNLSFSHPVVLAAVTAACLLSSCTTVPRNTVEAPAEEGLRPFATEGGEAGYHLLLAELALERNELGVAASEYRKAAELSDDAEIASQATKLAFRLGRDEDALVAARRWSVLEPDNTEAHRFLAKLLMRTGQESAAVEVLDTLLGLYDADPENGFLPLTGVLLSETDTGAANRIMQKLSARYPRVAAGHYGLGLMTMQHGQLKQARRHVEEAVALRPEWAQAQLLMARVMVASGEVDDGLELASEAARSSEDPTVRLDYALLLAGVEREGEARLELDLLLEEYPRLPGALRAAGLLELRNGNLPAAELHFTSLLATGRSTWEAFYYLGSIAEDRGQSVRAIRYYTQVRDGPLAVTAQARVANLYSQLNEPKRGVEHLLNFGSEERQFDVEMTVAAGDVLARTGDTARALEVYEEGLARHPGEQRLRYARAFLFDQTDRIDEAIEELRALLADNPDDPIALNALGYTLADRTDRHREAYRLISRALELAPDNPAIIDSMGWVEYRRGNYAEAVKHLQRAYSMIVDAEVSAHLIEALWMSGATDRALELLDSARREFSDAAPIEEVGRRIGQ